MTGPMDHEPLSPEIREAAEAYHRPPETPREEMWTAIQMARGTDGPMVGSRASRLPVHRSIGPSIHRWWAPAAIAAALALAFGLGRVSSRPETRWSTEPPLATAPGAGPGGSVALRVAAVEHLGQAESFLTLFRASVRSGARDALASPTARQLLATNRLLLDSPASADPKLRLLLEDLELVLAGIAQLTPDRASEDLDIITSDLERSAVLLRLRAAVPAGAAAPARPGAL